MLHHALDFPATQLHNASWPLHTHASNAFQNARACSLREQQAKQREAEDATFDKMGQKAGVSAAARPGTKRGAAAASRRANATAMAADADDEMVALSAPRRTQSRARGAGSQLARARATASTAVPDSIGTAGAPSELSAPAHAQPMSATHSHAPPSALGQSQASKRVQQTPAVPDTAVTTQATAQPGGSMQPPARKAPGRKRNRAAAQMVVD